MGKRVRPITANLLKHNVDEFEAVEALTDGWPRRRKDGAFYEVLGRTIEGRHLQIVCEETADEIRLFHARPMTDAEKKRYGKK